MGPEGILNKKYHCICMLTEFTAQGSATRVSSSTWQVGAKEGWV